MADRNNLPAGLLEDVKNQCDVTWGDEATDRKYRGYIASGMAYLDGKLGASDYTVDGMPRTLLMEYVRYAESQALDVFENNYRSLILGAQQMVEVKRYVEGSVPGES